jgi:hypothetical protein
MPTNHNISAFEMYSVNRYNHVGSPKDFSSMLSFYDDEGQIRAEISITKRHSIPELNDMYIMLHGHLRSLWAHPFFVAPVVIQAILITIAIVRFSRNRKAEKIGGNKNG